jgi:forkhead box protein J2/3
VPRPLTDRGKGSYWTVNDNVDPRTGVHRVRKKKPKGSKRRLSEEDQDVDYHPEVFNDPGVQFVQPPPMHPDEAGPSRQAPYPPYPPTYAVLSQPSAVNTQLTFSFRFDPNFQMLPPPPPGLRFPPVPIDDLEVDESGNILWRLSFMKELAHLQQISSDKDMGEDWYRMMLLRMRGAVMAPPPAYHDGMHPPPGMPPPPHPNPEMQQ